MDSWMYQTVGHGVVESCGACFEPALPVVRGEISEGGGEEAVKEREVEDLEGLLAEVLRRFPQVKAVSSGAVLSSYQRERVERVCQRLGLVSLAYLWQRDQTDLLQEMLRRGMKAVLVKVASLGLLPRDLDLKPLSPAHLTRFRKLHAEFGFHVCGEGGEYETLTLDCPLFARALSFSRARTVIHTDDPHTPVAYLSILEHSLIDKEVSPEIPHFEENLDDEEEDIDDDQEGESVKEQHIVPWIGTVISGPLTDTVEMTLEELIETVECPHSDALKGMRQRFSRVFFLQATLQSMDHFALLNKLCLKLFGAENPPARACVESQDLSIAILLSFFRLSSSSSSSSSSLSSSSSSSSSSSLTTPLIQLHCLHVQSLSCWAPACIGPYSQAVFVPELSLVMVAGQISLDPPTHTLAAFDGDVCAQARLIRQHIARILKAVPAANASADHIMLWNVFLPESLSDVAEAMRGVRSSLGIPDAGLVRWCLVSRLPLNALVEVQVIAAACFDDDPSSSALHRTHSSCSSAHLKMEMLQERDVALSSLLFRYAQQSRDQGMIESLDGVALSTAP